MSFLIALLFIAGMCIEFAGMLGMGWSWILGGALITLTGGIVWGLTPPSVNKM